MHFFDEIKSYAGFTAEDEDRLRKVRSITEAHFEDIGVVFYDALMAHPRARGVFTGPDQITRLRQSLKSWLSELFCGVYDSEYFQSRQRIGKAHVDVGLLPQFMFGAMSLVRNEFVEIFLDKERSRVLEVLGEFGPCQAVKSIDRILDIELTIMVQSYWDTLMKQKLQIPAALATGLAHEVRNPLNAIGLQMTLLERRLRSAEVDADVYEPVLEAVRSELRRIQGLNSEILDFAKPIDINPAPTDLEQMIREIHQSHLLTLEAGGVEMTLQSEGDVVLACDRDRLVQVLINLLTNAVEAMPDGGTLSVRLQGTDSGATIEFQDTGEGMPPVLKHQIFDLFYTTKAAGTGIGLPIARKIVEAHGGSIDVSSRSGEGTTFTVYLPRQR